MNFDTVKIILVLIFSFLLALLHVWLDSKRKKKEKDND